MDAEKRLTKADLIKSFLCWHSFAQSCYNYERMQALGFAHAMIPIINRLYSRPEEIASGLKRHLLFFNTEANIGSVIPGVMAALEEQKANGAEISDETISSLKTGLMGPLAGVGDTVTQGLVKTILLAFCVDIAAQGSAVGPLLFFFLFTAYTLGISWFMFMRGYRFGRTALSQMIAGPLVQRVTEGLTVLGLIVVGALSATRIPVATGVVIKFGKTAVALQDVFNQIMPGLLNLSAMLAIWLALRSGHSVGKILVVLITLGFAGAFTGILK